ncbi:MAG: alpha/beta hydrolase [Dehalococcoidia bacterium]|nr:alpha/beta hydrolase [Dehalococcoidia bacterium]
MIKRWASLLAVLVLLLCFLSQLLACGGGDTGKNATESSTSPANSSAATPASPPPGKTAVTTSPTPQNHIKALVETRIFYYTKDGWDAVAPPPRGPAETYQITDGSANYTSNLDVSGSLVHGVTTFIMWSAPPQSFVEGEEITFTARAWGKIDVRRQVTPVWALSAFSLKGDGEAVGLPTQVGTTADPDLKGQETKYTYRTPIDATECPIEIYVDVGPYRAWITYLYQRGVEDASLPAPLIFVPGIIGSQLVGQDGHVLWPPEGPGASRGFSNREAIRQDFVRLSLNPNTGPHEIVTATDVIRTDGTDLYYGPLLDYLVSKGGYKEYQVNNDPSRRTAFGFDRVQKDNNPTLFVFAYDWRLSIEDNAEALADYTAGIAQIYPQKKIDILAHSMGGLIARRFIIDNPGKVNRLISIASPFLGSPKPLYQMLYGTTGVSFTDNVAWGLFGDELKEMQAYYPGVHELMSTEGYFTLGGHPFNVLDYGKAGGRMDYQGEDVDFSSLMGPGGIVEERFSLPSYNGKTPAQSNRDFHAYSNGGNTQDDWSNDTTGVKYYHIIGVQNSGDTPLTLQESYSITSPPIPGWRFVKYGPGDGTVPRLSAERIGVDGRSLNAPGAQFILFTDGDDNLLEHTGLVTNPAVQSKVLDILKGS